MGTLQGIHQEEQHHLRYTFHCFPIHQNTNLVWWVARPQHIYGLIRSSVVARHKGRFVRAWAHLCWDCGGKWTSRYEELYTQLRPCTAQLCLFLPSSLFILYILPNFGINEWPDPDTVWDTYLQLNTEDPLQNITVPVPHTEWLHTSQNWITNTTTK